MVTWQGKYCAQCEDVVETCNHREERGYQPTIAVSVPFKPGWFHAIGARAESKKQLYEIAARKGRTLAKDQLP